MQVIKTQCLRTVYLYLLYLFSIHNINDAAGSPLGRRMVNLSYFSPKYEAWDFRYDMMVNQFERLEVEHAFRQLNSDATAAVLR